MRSLWSQQSGRCLLLRPVCRGGQDKVVGSILLGYATASMLLVYLLAPKHCTGVACANYLSLDFIFHGLPSNSKREAHHLVYMCLGNCKLVSSDGASLLCLELIGRESLLILLHCILTSCKMAANGIWPNSSKGCVFWLNATGCPSLLLSLNFLPA